MAIRLSKRSLPFPNTGIPSTGVLAKTRRRRRVACLGLGLLLACGGARAEEYDLNTSPEIDDDLTLIDGRDTLVPRSLDAGRHIDLTIVGATVTVDGFTNDDTTLGGGVFQLRDGSSIKTYFNNGSVVFAENRADGAGGGAIASDGGTSTLLMDTLGGGSAKAVFEDNFAKTSGGAIFARDSLLNLTNVSFFGNIAATAAGGAIYAEDTQTILTVKDGEKSAFAGNVTKNPGAGATTANSIHLSGGSLKVNTEGTGVLDMRDPMSGTGGVVNKNGIGTWKLAGDNNLDGTTFYVNEGTLYLYAEGEVPNPNNYDGDTGAKARTAAGSLDLGAGTFQLGSATGKATLAVSGFGHEISANTITFDTSVEKPNIYFDLRGSDGGGASALKLTADTITSLVDNIGVIDIANPKWDTATTLIETDKPWFFLYLGGLTSPVFRGEEIAGTRADGLLSLESSGSAPDDSDLLLRTGPAPAKSSNLTWKGDGSGNQWNINAHNWSGTLDGGGTTDQFLHGDDVVFDTAAATGGREIAVNPGGVVVNSLTFNDGDWKFTGGDILSSQSLPYHYNNGGQDAIYPDQLHPALFVNGTGTLTFDQRTFSEQWYLGSGSDLTVRPEAGATLTFSNPVSNILDDGVATIACGAAIYAAAADICNAGARGNVGKISVENALFTENQVALYGGAVYLDWGGTITLTDTSFVGNHAGTGGGTMFIGENAKANIIVTDGHTSLFSGNTAGGKANSIFFDWNGSLSVDTQGDGVLDMRDPMTTGYGGVTTKRGTGTWKLAGDNNLGSLNINEGTLYLYAKDEEENPNNKGVSGGLGSGATARTDAGSLTASLFTLGTNDPNDAPATLAVSGGGHTIEAGGLGFYSGSTLAFDLDGVERNGGAALTLKGAVDTDASLGLMKVGGGRIDVTHFDLANARIIDGDEYEKYVLVQADDAAYLDNSGDLYIDGTLTIPKRSSVAGATMTGLSLDEEAKQLSLMTVDATQNTVVTWTGAGAAKTWDTAAENWTGRVEGVRVKTFLDGDDAVFQTSGEAVNVNVGGVTARSVDVRENLTLSGGTVRATDNINVAQGRTLTVGSGTVDGSLAGAVALADDSRVVFNQNIADGSFGGTVGGTGSLVKNGARKLTLSGANTYTGATAVKEGTLEVTGSLGGGDYAGAIANDGALVFDQAGDQLLSGAVSGTGSLTKAGAGTLTLSGANSYTGVTTVREGTLALSGEGAISKSLAMYGGTAFVAAGAPVSLSRLDVHGSVAYTGDLDVSGGDLRFYVPSTMGDGGVLMKVDGTTNVTGADVNVGIDGAATALEDGDTIALIASGHLVGGIAHENAVVNGSGMQGVTKLLDLTVYTKGNDLLATVGTRANPRSEATSEGYLAGVAMLDQGADLVAGQGLGMAADNAHLPGWRFFGAGAGGSVSYETGAELNLDGVSLISGVSRGFEQGDDMLAVGGFFEYGRGDYGTYNTFDGFAPVSGRGDVGNIGGGGLAHLRLAGGDAGHAYIEASGRAGALHNRYASADLVDFSGRGAGYDIHLPYYGVHAGGGYVWNALENATVNVYGKYFLTRLEEGEVEMSSGETVRFDAVQSKRVRVGARFTYTAGAYAGFYGGGAWERLLGGEARGSVGNFAIEAPSLAGDSGVWEGGVTLKPSPRRKIALELGVQGYVGVRKGNTLSARVSWDF